MFHELLTLTCPMLLVLSIAIPRKWANFHVRRLRVGLTTVLGIQLLTSLLALLALSLTTPSGGGAVALTEQATTQLALGEAVISNLDHFDGVSGLMFLLVSFVGLVVTHFSVRYLDGDPQQGRYFCWLGFTLGAVSLLVISGNLVLLFAAWVMTSFGLHHLLLHFHDRPWAQRAAWTKFTISRLGDVFLLGALVLVYREFGTYHLTDILAAARESSSNSIQMTLIGWFIMLGAMTKSAQFPVHFWLPETMEAPTPVSALMHAGIVNAGGYLIIRLSPLVVHAPSAMAALAVGGAVTAVFAGVVMLTQTSVKRSLGYSTIAQMGFMMLQCGLGAFVAAMLHILAHSLYKAYAFLSSGEAWRVEQIPRTGAYGADFDAAARTDDAPTVGVGPRGWIELAIATAFTVLAFAGVTSWFGLASTGKAGGIVLATITCLAIASWLTMSFTASWRSIGRVLGFSAALLLMYAVGYSLVSYVIAADVAKVKPILAASVVGVLVVTAFVGVLTLQCVMPQTRQRRWLQALYVHAMNGFYIDTLIRRSLGLSLSRTP